MFTKKLAKNPPHIFIMLNELEIKVYSLINAINIIMIFTILKTKLFPRSVTEFDKMYKKI